jgi:Fe-S cluster assembly iron-binding protein IscA
MLTITDEAKAELENVLEQNPGKALRLVMAGFG